MSRKWLLQALPILSMGDTIGELCHSSSSLKSGLYMFSTPELDVNEVTYIFSTSRLPTETSFPFCREMLPEVFKIPAHKPILLRVDGSRRGIKKANTRGENERVATCCID